ncbi:putative iron-regulated membrane protein [Novosphingobium sp. 1529]|uniref:PepSY domain-containing protein n=1 Tax=unclassified Novosphingobium TaxID=2644732 RepID=UPI000AF4B998|nr:PepSY domain-containing protein [Novosphingobium sp. AAP1]
MSSDRNTRNGKAWRWPLSPETVRAALSGHGALGLAFAGVIYLVCLTGTLTVFTPDWQHWEVPRAPVVATLADAAACHALAQAAQVAPPGATLSLTARCCWPIAAIAPTRPGPWPATARLHRSVRAGAISCCTCL